MVLSLKFSKLCVIVLFFTDVISVAMDKDDFDSEPVVLSEVSRSVRSYEVRRSKEHAPVNSLKSVPATQGALFMTPNSTVVYAQIGGTAKLPCVVRKFNSGVVSWIRKEDSPPTILTIGLSTYIADDRILIEHARHLQNWGLVIKHVKHEDEGLYECQVSTHPTTSIFLQLKVTEAIAEILGAPDMHIRAGSQLRVVCMIRHSTEQPAYVFWYHENRMINHDQGVTVTDKKSSSILRLQEADTSHSGNYTCVPANAVPAFVNVHVLNATEEENPAAMMHANSSDVSTALFIAVLFALFTNILIHLDS